MLIQGIANKNRFNELISKYEKLINSGESPENILVILLNSYKKTNFINEIKLRNPNINLDNHKIYTFWGLCYNAFIDNWEYISNLIGIKDAETKPNLCGLEVSQYIFKQSIKTADFSDYISKINLLHQLFRRYSLIVQNEFTQKEVQELSILLNESFYEDAQKTIDDYKLKTIQYKSFDYLRQLAVFPHIYKNTKYFKKINYLIVDDADEFSFAFWKFIDFIMPQIKDYYIAYDKEGTTRSGYLCAYKNGINDFKKKYNPTEKEINTPITTLTKELYNAIKNNKKYNITFNNYSKRLDMIESVIKQLSTLIKSGIKPSDIAIITPIIDDVLVKTLENVKNHINFQYISGSEKLNSSNIVKHLLIVLKLINQLPVLDYELKSLLTELLKIPYRKSIDIIDYYSKEKELKRINFEEANYDYIYNKLYAIVMAEKKHKNKLSEQIKIVYTNLLKDIEINYDIEKYDFLLKEAQSFEIAFGTDNTDLIKEFISQIQNTVISENPADSFSLDKNAIIVSSPQKIIDYSLKTKYQFILDISNNEWMKQDTGTLYNAWVLNRDWTGCEYKLEDNIRLNREKAARVMRKLLLCADEYVLFSSIYDNTGNENFGGIADFIEQKETTKVQFNITPRQDQKPVLDYKNGNMGVMAVPGAGKTTILLLLIINMIKNGIKPENIFVLTYMESAAKNFKDKLQDAIPNNNDLPNISTIHGLALRIIKENGNYIKVGLDDKFEIADDNIKEKLIKELFFKLKIDDEKYDNYLKCISIVKLSGNNKNLHSKYKEIQDFYDFYNEYNIMLKEHNLIDYDDMLYFSVKILEENPEILEYYQKLCIYIIEDEAQDSTDIQQRLIKLLNGKYNNFVRCGDINQAITSTFTNSNPDSFRKFILNNNKVEMNSSQRCSTNIYNLANKLISEVCKDEMLKNAFYKIEMQCTDKNPQTELKPQYLLYDNEKEEKQFVLNRVSEIIKKEPKASIAVLLRLNSQVNEYNELFIKNGIQTSVRSDCLAQKIIYKIVISILKIIENPYNNTNIIELATEYGLDVNCIDYINGLKIPFMKQEIDDIQEEGLIQLYWDIDYWLNNSFMPADILILNLGLYYAKNTSDKSNAYMISTIVKRLISETDNLNEIINKLEYAAQKSMSAYRFFEDENINKEIMPVSIMTTHKAKGDEFDYVFIPEFNEENYSTQINTVKLKSGNHFIQTIKNSVENCGLKQQEELKLEQIYETLRLIYVGITRAKKGLYMTNSLNYRKRRNTKPVEIVQKLIE